MLVAGLGIAVAVEQLIDRQIDDHVASTMLTLIVVLIAVVSLTPTGSARKS